MFRSYSFLFAFLLLIAFCYAQPWSATLPFEKTVALGTFNFNQHSDGNILITVTGNYSLQLCFQQNLYVLGPIENCDPNGLVLVTFPKTQAPQKRSTNYYHGSGGGKFQTRRHLFADNISVNATINLILDTLFYVSARFVDSAPPNVNSSAIIVTAVPTKTCPEEGDAYNGCANVSPIGGAVTVPNGNSYWSYAVTTPNLNNLTIRFNIQTEAVSLASQNVSVTVRRRNVPTGNFTTPALVTVSNSSVTVVIDGPYQDTYFFLVANNGAQFSANVQTTPGPNCALANQTGSSCSPVLPVTVLNGSLTEENDIKGGVYFKITTSNLLFGVAKPDYSDGAPAIYASYVNIPNQNSSLLYADYDADKEINFISAQTTAPVTWLIFVLPEDGDSEFVWWSNSSCANNCTGRGVCDSDTGVCSCDEGYENFFCSARTFPRIYIVIIVIGGAIVLGIAVGVPVGCYVKNRKKARYERV